MLQYLNQQHIAFRIVKSKPILVLKNCEGYDRIPLRLLEDGKIYNYSSMHYGASFIDRVRLKRTNLIHTSNKYCNKYNRFVYHVVYILSGKPIS